MLPGRPDNPDPLSIEDFGGSTLPAKSPEKAQLTLRSHAFLCVGLIVLIAGLFFTATGARADEEESPESTHDGLVLFPDSRLAHVYIKPGADFSLYKRMMILEAYVAFRKGWQQDQMRASTHKITTRDMERIKEEMSELFLEVFVDVLSSNDGYPIADAVDKDVLLLRPAIIDLDVTSPDLDGTSRSYNFSSSAGSATLFLEFHDSVSGEILARVVDQQTARNPGDVMRISNKVTNRAEAKKILAGWAGVLRESLDELHGKAE